MRGVGRRAQYVSCFSSGSVVCDGGPSAVEDAMRHRRVALRCHRCGVCYGSCAWNVRASSLQSPASPGARGKRCKKKKKKKRNYYIYIYILSTLSSPLSLSLVSPLLPVCLFARQTPTGLSALLLSVASSILVAPSASFTFLPFVVDSPSLSRRTSPSLLRG